jgi:hypothetical protein
MKTLANFGTPKLTSGCPGADVVAGSILGSGAGKVMGALGRVESTEKI